MMQAPTIENTTPFSYEALVELYEKLVFSKRAKTLELFLREDAPLPKKSSLSLLYFPLEIQANYHNHLLPPWLLLISVGR